MVTKTSLPTDWEFVKAIDHIDFIRGQEPGSKHYNTKGHGQRFIRVGNLSGKREEAIFTDLSNLSACNKSDILMSFDGSPGIVCRGFEGIYSSGIRKIILKNTRFDRNFTYYVLQSSIVQDLIAIHAEAGTTIKHAGKSIPLIRIPAPPLSEQQKIAAILNSVDDAIQATQAVIDQTQRVKQGLLQHLLTHGIGHTRFKQTEIGDIPESWNIQKLRFLLSEPIKNGYSPICPKDPTGNWILNLSAVSPNGLNVKAVKPAPKNDLKVSKFLLHSGDFLVSRSNTRERVGFSIMYRGEIENCSYPDLLMRFRIDNRYILDEFLENYLTYSFALGFLQRAAAGTSASMVKINKKILESLPVLVPPIEEQRNISTHIQITKNSLKHLQDELLTFSNIKRGLMQDLLTGHVRVKPDEVNTT